MDYSGKVELLPESEKKRTVKVKLGAKMKDSTIPKKSRRLWELIMI